MNFSDSFVTDLLLVSNAVLLATSAVAVIRFRRQCRRYEAFWNSPTGMALTNGDADEPRPAQPPRDPTLERRVTELQAVVRTLAERSRRSVSSVDSKLPIENAVRMARQGASIDELTRSCGLNVGEARLMRKLHGKAPMPGKSATTH